MPVDISKQTERKSANVQQRNLQAQDVKADERLSLDSVVSVKAAARSNLSLSYLKGIIGVSLMYFGWFVFRVRFDIRAFSYIPVVFRIVFCAALVGIYYCQNLTWLFALYGLWLCAPGFVVEKIQSAALGNGWQPMIAWGNVMSRRIFNFFVIQMNPFLSVKIICPDEHQALPNRYVAICNHFSNWDPYILSYALQSVDSGKPAFFAYKNVLDLFPIGGGTLPTAGNIRVNRSKRSHDSVAELMESSRQRIMDRKAACICAFPEGTRSQTGKIQPFKQGYPRFALQHQVDVVPCLIVNSLESWPAFSLLKMATAEVTIVVGKPVKPLKIAKQGEPSSAEVAAFVKDLEIRTADLISAVPEKDRPFWWGQAHPASPVMMAKRFSLGE